MQTNLSKQPVVKGVVKRSTALVLAIIVGVVFALGAAWFVFYHNYVNQVAPLTETQERTKDSIQGQEQSIQEAQAAPDGTKAAMLANLAQSHAYVGECAKARQALAEAKKIAPADAQVSMQRTEAYVKGFCP